MYFTLMIQYLIISQIRHVPLTSYELVCVAGGVSVFKWIHVAVGTCFIGHMSRAFVCQFAVHLFSVRVPREEKYLSKTRSMAYTKYQKL
mmetsp:Transcript_10616/g.16092  ORF Transcript_10616/g.16092 Transcript_10616/m.16092 type:complete len:89 (-) Transcript_10616:192-458(-)